MRRSRSATTSIITTAITTTGVPIGFSGPAFVGYAAYGGCYVKRWVATPWGYKVRWVNRCF